MLLNDGLTTIGKYCFNVSGLETVAIPASVIYIELHAFAYSSLTQLRFLGPGKEPHCEHSSDSAEDDGWQYEYLPMIGERAFADCMNLR